MRGLMQDVGLTLQMVTERVGELYGDKTVATKTAEGIRRRSYSDVVERVTRLAAALTQLGIKPGDRVGTFAWNSDHHLELYLAVPCMGAVLHTLNPRLPADQIGYIAEHADDKLMFVDASVAPAWQQVPPVAGIRAVVVMDDATEAGRSGAGVLPDALDYEALLDSADASFAWPRLDEGDAAAMCYTSGTTGMPKGLVYSHRSSVLHAMASLFVDCLALSERDVLLPIVPQFHVNAWGTPYAALLTGASLAMPGRFMADPPSLATLVAEEGVTVSAAVPTVWFGVLQAIRAGVVDPAKLSSLQRIVCGGSAVPEALLRGFDDLGIRMIQAWGMTETSPLGTVANLKTTIPEDRAMATRLTQGIPAPSLRVRVVTDDEQVAPWNGSTMGELQINGPWIADAYYDPQAPQGRGGQDRFTEDESGRRWLKTGDVAVIDADGYVQLLDRTSDLVKSGGEWISTVELENLLIAHDKVREAAVIAVAHAKWGERPLACVVKADASVTTDELLAYLGEHVARWQVPDDIVFVDEVPKTTVGKFDKKVLRKRYGDYQLQSSNAELPPG
ncbi:MAG: long-chain fatty acid--CoA ligase [Actinomycetota bacterium]|nr:long-chain fatty acid--CoA ligase [Actinomycetota bacterium]